MKKVIEILVIAGMIFLTSSCRSQGNFSVKETAKFGAGFASGVLAHETGHYLVAKAEGMDNVKIHPTKVTYEYDKYSKSAERNIAMAGFGADIIGSEIVMSNDKLFPKDNNFVLGYLAWTMIEPLSYTLRHELSSNGYGDLKGLDETGIDARAVEVGLIAHAALTYYRLKKNPDFPLYVEAGPDRVFANWKWRF